MNPAGVGLAFRRRTGAYASCKFCSALAFLSAWSKSNSFAPRSATRAFFAAQSG